MIRRFQISTLILVLSLGFIQGCSDSEQSAQTDAARPEAVQEATEQVAELQASVKEAAADAVDAAAVCDLLSEDMLRSHFELAADTEVERRPSEYSPHPLCIATWNKPDAEQMEQAYQAAMNDYIMARARGEKVKMPLLVTTNEVSLTLYEPLADSPEQAAANFDSAMQVLSKGVTAKAGGVEATFQADVSPINGLGDKAMWAAKMNQISVLDGRRIFHVAVKVGDKEENKTRATTLAVNLTQLL